jgi:hypothetical protein
MVKERTRLIIRLITTHIIIIPVLVLLSILFKKDAYLLLSVSQTLVLIIFLAGYWEFFGFRNRMYISGLMEIIILGSLWWKIFMEPSHSSSIILITFLSIIQLYLIIELIKIFVVIFRSERHRFEVSFPFKNGRYLITDGGNSKISRLMNYHFYSPVHVRNKTNYSMLFATDIVRIETSQRRFFPSENEDYPIFGEKVFSPMSGTIFKIENSVNDNIPYCGNYPYSTGNTIVIRNDDRYMLLGHLKMGSIIVKEGDEVHENDYLAEAGNSGYSERPHIHMQLIESSTDSFWKGRGISIQYKNQNLFKNRIIEML